MDLKELTSIEVSATGKTQPHIPSGTEIILVQDGVVSVGRYNYDLDEDCSMEIEHPVNQDELNPRATEIIKLNAPLLLKSEVAQIVTCSTDIKNKMVWKS